MQARSLVACSPAEDDGAEHRRRGGSGSVGRDVRDTSRWQRVRARLIAADRLGSASQRLWVSPGSPSPRHSLGPRKPIKALTALSETKECG